MVRDKMQRGAAELIDVADLQRVLEVIPAAALLVATDGRVVGVNARAESLLHRSRSDLMSGAVDDAIPGLLQRIAVARRGVIATSTAERAAEQGDDTELHIHLHRGGDIPVRIDAGRVATATGEHIDIVLVRDLSASNAANEELRAAHAKLAANLEETRAHSHLAQLVNKVAELVQAATTEEQIYPILEEFCPLLFPAASGVVYMRDMSRTHLLRVARWGAELGEPDAIVQQDCWALRLGRLCGSHRPEEAPRCAHVPAGLDYVCSPLSSPDEMSGVLTVLSRGSGDLLVSEGSVEAILTALTNNVSLAIANVRLRSTLETQSIRDPLTGLFNRRYLEDVFRREARPAIRHNRQLSLAILDVDHFKDFNDIHGHDAADSLLRDLGRLLERRIRTGEDSACRYGGDEFVIVLPDTDVEQARQRMEDLRERIQQMAVHHLGSTYPGVSVTIGVATNPAGSESLDSALHAADEALRAAKQAGRNRVEVRRSVDLTAAERALEMKTSAEGRSVGPRTTGPANHDA